MWHFIENLNQIHSLKSIYHIIEKLGIMTFDKLIDKVEPKKKKENINTNKILTTNPHSPNMDILIIRSARNRS